MMKVLGGPDVRLSVIDNDPNGMGKVIGSDHFAQDLTFGSSQVMDKIAALGTNKPVDRVPGSEDNTYSMTVHLAYDDQNPSLSFGTTNGKLFKARGKSNLLIILTFYERGWADKPTRDSHVLEVLTLNRATLATVSVPISAQNVATAIAISGEYGYLSFQKNTEFSDVSGL